MMKYLHVKYSKGQLKIQEMAFVLVGMIIFFGIASLFYLSIRTSNLRESAVDLQTENAKEIARKISDAPELSFAGCSGCIDIDKAFVIKDIKAYQSLWGLDYLQIEKIYPKQTERECSKSNYPDCNKITIINKTLNYGNTFSSFVSLCREENGKKCYLGRIYVSGGGINAK